MMVRGLLDIPAELYLQSGCQEIKRQKYLPGNHNSGMETISLGL